MSTPQSDRRQFASDNWSGICPEAWEALTQANHGHAPAYGEDQWTAGAADKIRELFETDCEVFFAFNGTAANSMALASLCDSYHSVICHEKAHVEMDECGAPEFFSGGSKILLASGEDGKIDPAEIEKIVTLRSDIHYPKPHVVTLTEATELGTVYTPTEIGAIREVANKFSLHLHMDGARLASAISTLGVAPKEVTWQAGVDVLCLGGTKDGMAFSEAVVFFDRDLAHEFDFRCKQAGQLASKMRFLAAPWIGMLESGAWLRHAAHANAMAARLEAAVRTMPEVKVLHPVQANAVFADIPAAASKSMRKKGWRYHDFIGGGGCRLMCSWDTTESDVDDFAADLKASLGE